MNIKDIAKLLANKINQAHYIEYYLNQVSGEAYRKGLKEGKTTLK
jgi:hypothetical protein